MPVGRRCRFLLLLLPLFATGCGPLFGLPTVWPPESQKTQIARASKFDPFPDPNMGPAVIGGRPQGFLNPRPEPDPNKTVRSDWFYPAPGAGYPPAVYYPGAAAAYPPPTTTIYTYPSTVAVAPPPGALHCAAGRLFRAGSSANARRPSHRFHPRRQPRRRLLTARRSIPPDRAVRSSYDEISEGTSHSAAIALELCLRPAMPQTRKLKNRSRRHGGPAPKSRQRRGETSRSVALFAKRMTLAWCDCKRCWPRRGSAAGGSARKSSARGASMSTAKRFRNWAPASIRFSSKIRVDGETVSRPKRRLYFLINKPVGILSTNQDPSGRPRVIDLAPSRERLFTVGRLDKTSEGLILATNDGQLTDLLTHPRYGVEKTYWAPVAGTVSPEAVSKLERGVHLAEGYAHAKRVTVRRAHKQSTILEIVLDEGRNREVRRLLARIGHKVLKLRRIAIGPLRLGNMKPGESRPLLRDEVEALYEAARERRRQSDKGTKKPTTRLKTAADTQGLDASDASGQQDEVRPLIDHSLSPDELGEQDAFSIDVVLDDESHDDDSGNEPGFEGLADGEQFVGESNQEPATARVDLSPILPGKPGRGAARTLIGADPQRRKDFRTSRRRGGHGEKPQGSTGGRKRRRP